MSFILAIDQSTSATKAILFDREGRPRAEASLSHQQHYPRPGWVEHDAEEIYRNTLAACQQLLHEQQVGAEQLLCLSVTNQRETVVVFDRQTGKPLHRAIVWQCRRGAPICEQLLAAGHGETVRRKTGLILDTYFSGSKLRWQIETHPEIAQRLADGNALIGTIDTYLLYRLTGGKVFATDPTNACRTLLYDIHQLAWDAELCDLFRVPVRALAEVRESRASFGGTTLEGMLRHPIPICGVMGDSQAALFAQRCLSPGMGKATFGTGTSLLLNIGSRTPQSESGIVSTLAWVYQGKPTYALEGVLNYTGATIAWLKDQLGLIASPAETEALAMSVSGTGGVYLVPAFVGLGAPYWDAEARGAIVGLSPHSTRAHVVRAALESIGYQIRDVLGLMASEAGIPLQSIRADGGMVRNQFLMQFVADVTGTTVEASEIAALSPFGAALAGMLGSGTLSGWDALDALPRPVIAYHPQADPASMDKLYAGWQTAVQRVRS